MPGYNPRLRGYDYNPEKAREILRKSGLPLPLRTVQKAIMLRSPLHTGVENQYSLAPLLKYFIEEYQPPKELLGSATSPE